MQLSPKKLLPKTTKGAQNNNTGTSDRTPQARMTKILRRKKFLWIRGKREQKGISPLVCISMLHYSSHFTWLEFYNS